MGLGEGKDIWGDKADLPDRPEVMERQLLARRDLECDVLSDEDRRRFWSNPEFFKEKSGDVVDHPWKAYNRGAVTLPRGEKIFRDAGVVFYKVQRGDVESVIIEKLGRYKEFAYLRCLPDAKILGFNIPDDRFRVGEWIPLPLNPELMTYTDEEFVTDCRWAIDDLQSDERYGERLRSLVAKVGADELVATMMAFAKSESGDPIGTYAHYRCEAWQKNGIRDYSLSVFHIKMEAGGLLGRKHLGLTQGQMFHPKNAARVFLIFWLQKEQDVQRIILAEKMRKEGKNTREIDEALSEMQVEYDKHLPLPKDIDGVCDFYNGLGWRRDEDTPLRYDRKLLKYYLEAVAFLGGGVRSMPKPEPKPVPTPTPKPVVPESTVPEHILTLQKSKRAVVIKPGEGMLKAMKRANASMSDADLLPYVKRLEAYFRQMADSALYPSAVFKVEGLRPGDVIGFDRRKRDGATVLIFWRSGMEEEAWLKLSSV